MKKINVKKLVLDPKKLKLEIKRLRSLNSDESRQVRGGRVMLTKSTNCYA